ncbi:PA2169 family four-helix-bundle protein [Epilithonimonas hominis]|uniref:PA2169 family four-helix-bundle protein n=1 Tax=Epilithonimonas hominis TaxID=420404 RepID=A0A3N0XBA6_9FLAO|nr:PA2169 family four-helix-bundle protein [Epilithonimonas hominis]ROI14652.1 PA2169 family four-helix-bundle protein [Epilithonimonas hominis]
MNNDKTISVLNDLLNITNDRIAGFAKVADKVWQNYADLKPAYDDMVAEAWDMKDELIDLIERKGGHPDNETSISGAFHRAWIDVKNTFASDKVESTLENVVFGEKAAINAFQNALNSGELCRESEALVSKQLQQLSISYDKFKVLEKLS